MKGKPPNLPKGASDLAGAGIMKELRLSQGPARGALGSIRSYDTLAALRAPYRDLMMPNLSAAALAARGLSISHATTFQKGGASEVMKRVAEQHTTMMKSMQEALGVGLTTKHLTPAANGELQRSISELTRSLHTPKIEFGSQLTREIERIMSGVNDAFRMPQLQIRSVAEELAKITRPWAMIGNEKGSFAAALGLAQFSDLSGQLKVFSPERLTFIDREFGAFDAVFAVAEATDGESEGEAIYTEAGRNEALVAFPSESFNEVLSATGWAFDVPQPEFIRMDGTVVPSTRIDPHDHYLINLIEGHLRQVVYAALVSVGGEAALKRLFGNRLPNWRQKQADAIAKGEEALHPIYYADFMELAEIILNKELWQATFASVFLHRDRFKISMERLHGFRLQTSHTRPLKKTGRLRLWVEAREIFDALGIGPQVN